MCVCVCVCVYVYGCKFINIENKNARGEVTNVLDCNLEVYTFELQPN